MNQKDYQNWSPKKADIHNGKERPFFHIREVWFCSLGENVGFEQDGVGENFLRPVLVIRKFNNEIFWGLPLTRTAKTGKYYLSTLVIKEDGVSDAEPSSIILSQIRLIDAKRLQYKIGTLNEEDFKKTKEALQALLK